MKKDLHQRGHPSLLKRVNKSLVLRTIRQSPRVSRYEVAKVTNLSPNTVATMVDELMQDNLVLDMGIRETPFGRKPRDLRHNPDAAFVIATEIETHGITVARINLDGKIIQIKHAELNGIYEQEYVLQHTIELAEEIISQDTYSGSKILGVAIGVTGFVDAEKGIGVFSPPFGWENVPYKQMFESRFNIPTYIENVDRLHALGEKMYGAGNNAESLIFAEVEYGIGGGIILNNMIYRGIHGSAGEIGHTVVIDDGPVCHCGNKGCLEAVINETRLIAIAKGQGVFSDDGKDSPTIVDLVIAAGRGNKVAYNILLDAAKHFARVVANVINTFDPKVVVLSGKLFRNGDLFFDMVKKLIIKDVFNITVKNLSIERAQLGNHGCVLGGGAWLLQQLSADLL